MLGMQAYPLVDLRASLSCLLSCLQLWQASGQLQQRLTCDRDLYFPDSAVTGPVAKQVPEEGPADVQQGKRAKLAGGQYRRGSFREAAASDSTPPGTPYRPSRSAAAEERVNSNAMASSSSSQDLGQSQQQRTSSGTAWDCEPAWPLVVPNKRRRSTRLRRSQWQQWQSVLQDLDAAASPDCTADVGGEQSGTAMRASGSGALLEQQQQHILVYRQQQPQQPGDETHQPSTLSGRCQQQECMQVDVQHQDQARVLATCTPAGLLQMQPPAPKAAASEHCLTGKLVLRPVAGDASPGHETSQASEMTCMQESPHAVAVLLSSWPSTSTDSDCQGQLAECDAPHKLSHAAGKTAVMIGSKAAVSVGNTLPGQVFSPESPSSPFQGAVC